jgi:transposase-like protein
MYVLLNNKQQATYKRVFEKLMEIEPTLRPESIVSDFEISAMNAINEVFPNAQITGCMFYLAQNLWKKIQKTHLEKMRTQEKNVRCY